MSIKNWPGGRISSIPPTPSGPFQYSTASGVWTLDQVAYWRSQNQWPTAGNVPTDPDFEYVTMLLHGDGTNGAQNNTFLDSSTNNFTITRNGNTTQGSFSPYGPNWSNFFDGSGDYLTTATSASAFSFGTGDFTIEFWINSTQTTRCDPVGQDTAFSSSGWWGLIGNLSSSGQLQWFENTNSRISATATNWNNGSWNHIAVTRSGNSVRMFVNGTQVGSTYTTSFTYGASNVGVIAGVLSDDKTTGPLTGYLSNLRIVKGTALYTGTFTPSTTPLTAVSGTSLLTCADNRFIDDSTNNLTITRTGDVSVQRFSPFAPTAAYSTATIGGSGYFDGNTDALTVNGMSSSVGDFCLEMWFYSTVSLTTGTRVVCGEWGGGLGNLSLIRFNGGNFEVNLANTAVLNVSAATHTFIAFGWQHMAITRSGSTLRLFANGIQVASATFATSVNFNRLNIAGERFGAFNTECWAGYMTDSRVVIGSAVYTSNFTPPTAPLSAITNTSLLLNYTNGAIFDNAMMNDLETVGNAQISTSVVKFGTGSLYFDGSGDWMSTVNKPPINLAGDFTVEAWLYQAVSGTNSPLIALGSDTFQNGTFIIYINTNQNFGIYVNGSVTLGSTVATVATWHHVAMVRSGSTITGYLNGTSQFTITSFVTFSGPIELGATVFGGNRLFGNGYIDDLRITNGVARYTANFTPPTAAFPDT